MATPLAATGRITIPYTIAGFVHKFRIFVRGLAPVGGSFNHNSRALDENDQVWTDSADALATTLSYVTGAALCFGDAVLEQQSGGIWTALATHTPSYVDHTPGAGTLGKQITLVLRDITLKKVKFVVLDAPGPELYHSASQTAIAATEAYWGNFVKQFMSIFSVTHAPYNWAVGRGNQYLNTSPLVGFTLTSNRRLRRRRGLT